MKFSTTLIVSSLALGAFAQLQSSPLACSNSIRSCTSAASDTCCSPKLGLLVLALQWVPSLGPNNAFTVHGLWPDNCDGSQGPSGGCDASRQYNDLGSIVGQDSQLLSEMNTYWASYKGNNPEFWEHEWGKHGTCHSIVDPKCYDNFQTGQDARDYFKQALALRKKFDLYNVLKDSGIVPGRSYPKSQFISAFNKLGAGVQLVCKGKSINEVRIFLYINGKQDYVITNALNKDSCPNTINYPTKN